ncbi:hypothetical protein D910_10502 [Dendroctonus ponderosae]|uniref:Uncharacterized protein n=1 Tax=Dendroctonus ponderosae TaxID=77166 RepID=U4USX2_DENPD|nr:hypothetical protein D910_10502 [Dendroctonus ponderosae]
MQLTNSFPWQFTANGIPQVWATNGLQSQALLTHNPIFIRGTQADGTPGMFIQQNPQTIQTQQNQAIATQATVTQAAKQNRPINENIQPKQANRPLNILPSNATIRPASSVSTQTISAQTPNQCYSGMNATGRF